jgi:glucose-like phosphotransferase system IIB component
MDVSHAVASPRRSDQAASVVVLVLLVPGYVLSGAWSVRWDRWRRHRPGAAADGTVPNGTPGEPDSDTSQAERVLMAFGGFPNITSVDACITRLRISVKDKGRVDRSRLKALGSAGVIEVGDNLQAIFGAHAKVLKAEILDLPGASGLPDPRSQDDASGSRGGHDPGTP